MISKLLFKLEQTLSLLLARNSYRREFNRLGLECVLNRRLGCKSTY